MNQKDFLNFFTVVFLFVGAVSINAQTVKGKVADNSGAKNLMCIRVLGSNRRYGFVGDVIIGVVKDATPNLTVKRSDVVRAVIVLSLIHI